MISQLLKALVDLIYGTARARKKYEMNNPTETVLAADGAKGILTKDLQEITRGLNWAVSQRAIILLTNKKVICGKWTISLEDIATAQLLKVHTLLGGGQVLKIQTNDNKYYQFGMQLNPEWTTQKILPLSLEKGKIKDSPFSLVVRLIAFGYLIYWLYVSFFN